MVLRRLYAFVLALLTAVPYACAYLANAMIRSHFEHATTASGHHTTLGSISDLTTMWLILGGALLGLILLGLYILIIWRSPRVPTASKRFWTKAIILGGPVTVPIFWYKYVWKEQPVEKRRTLQDFLSGA